MIHGPSSVMSFVPDRDSQFEAGCGAAVNINRHVANSMTNLELTTKKEISSFGIFILLSTTPLSVGTELICSDCFETRVAGFLCCTVYMKILALKQMEKQFLTNCSRQNPYHCYE
jgi:hypothetical protein